MLSDADGWDGPNTAIAAEWSFLSLSSVASRPLQMRCRSSERSGRHGPRAADSSVAGVCRRDCKTRRVAISPHATGAFSFTLFRAMVPDWWSSSWGEARRGPQAPSSRSTRRGSSRRATGNGPLRPALAAAARTPRRDVAAVAHYPSERPPARGASTRSGSARRRAHATWLDSTECGSARGRQVCERRDAVLVYLMAELGSFAPGNRECLARRSPARQRGGRRGAGKPRYVGVDDAGGVDWIACGRRGRRGRRARDPAVALSKRRRAPGGGRAAAAMNERRKKRRSRR